MNVGLYSLKNMTARKIGKLSRIIQKIFPVNDIYTYSENIPKQRISKREGLKKIIQDYNEGKVDLIVFEKLSSLGSDACIKGKALELLMKEKVKFFIIQENIDSTLEIGKQKIQILILIGEKQKEMNEQRNRTSNIDSREMKNVFIYTRVGNQDQLS